MNLKATIISLVTVLVIGLTAILLYCFWPAIKGTIDNSKYYTQEELQESYDKGYNDGCKTETELIGQVKYYKDLVDEYYIQVNTLNNEITILTNNNTEKQESINLLTSQKNELAETVTSLTTTKENNEQTISTLYADIDTLTAEKQALIDDNAAKDDEIDKLNALIAEKNARIAELESSVDDKDTEIATLRLEVSDLQNQVSNLQIVKTNQETQITALTNQVSNLQSLVTQLQDTNSLHLQTIDTLNTQVKSLNTKISELKAESQNNDVTVSQLNARIDALEESITYYESFIVQLESDTQVVATFEFDGSVYNIQILSKNSCSSVVEPTSTEYVIFNGWLLEDGTSVEPATYPLSTNTIFHADVTYKYNAEFVDEDNSLDIQIVESGNYATEPTSPTKEGYEFLGWSRDGV
ncbi:MAG: InlB B-repeat-containing protein, partial [Clostridia bacterium]|nr:InlB B-repeat-containing protein [Clostridia bacterium]